MTADHATIRRTLQVARDRLLQDLGAADHWTGELCASALSTAVAVLALDRIDRGTYHSHIEKGLCWLAANANDDGGWGDTVQSQTNLSTTLLCWCALNVSAAKLASCAMAGEKAEHWLCTGLGSLTPDRIAEAVLSHYGADRTFSAPILATCAAAGRLGDAPDCWRFVPQLPFEYAVLSHRLFRWLRLSVVSYAIPALIAIGLLRHRQRPTTDRLIESIRNRVTPRALRVLASTQPDSGGFLEAVPLTAFVALSLAAIDQRESGVVRAAAEFLRGSMRPDGSWPIDTNLATWVTTLAANALGDSPELRSGQRRGIRSWLLTQQLTQEHPFTHAAPGGWAWTDLSGGVPDADDTSGVLLALRRTGTGIADVREAVDAGIQWLAGLQNADGGIPTFCRGWGKLPFDQSCPDITAHALQAFDAWYDDMPPRQQSQLDFAMQRAVQYLSRTQHEDGAWVPLWFGNESAPLHQNPTYGTARVVAGLRSIAPERLPSLDVLVEDGARWLVQAQGPDGGWGGAPGLVPSIEETALAVRALAGLGHIYDSAAERGALWLAAATREGSEFPATPIGLYFASLWYSERLYPVIFTVDALRHLLGSL